ncbi:hypothetical protein RND71_009397 [Anisodus tanguticus]|uniref:Uncharacterized protein n=1 Tax=Anisodus tanguticus TaxID=243964 RepID=A0AAE1VI51_9SOLA|nr:hypothetical protein RND71_009397 [Anisodus tanguticus]
MNEKKRDGTNENCRGKNLPVPEPSYPDGLSERELPRHLDGTNENCRGKNLPFPETPYFLRECLSKNCLAICEIEGFTDGEWSVQRSKAIKETDVQIQKGGPCTLCDEDYVAISQKENEKSTQPYDWESENNTMLVENVTENVETHPMENEQPLVNNKEAESLSSGHTTSDYNESQTIEPQSPHESPNSNDKLTSSSNDFGAGPMQASKDTHDFLNEAEEQFRTRS